MFDVISARTKIALVLRAQRIHKERNILHFSVHIDPFQFF